MIGDEGSRGLSKCTDSPHNPNRNHRYPCDKLSP